MRLNGGEKIINNKFEDLYERERKTKLKSQV